MATPLSALKFEFPPRSLNKIKVLLNDRRMIENK